MRNPTNGVANLSHQKLWANSCPCTSAGTPRPRVWTFCSSLGLLSQSMRWLTAAATLFLVLCLLDPDMFKLLRTSPQAPQCWTRRTRNMLDILVSGMLHFRGFSRPFSGVASTPYPIFFTNMGIFFQKIANRGTLW